MDYFSYDGKFRGFVFDLQRFDTDPAPVEISVDLTSVKSILSTGTKYLVEVGDADPVWRDTPASGEEKAVATLTGGKLTVFKANTGDSVNITGATADDLMAAGITLEASLSGAADSTVFKLKKSADENATSVTGVSLHFITSLEEVLDTQGVATVTIDAKGDTTITLTENALGKNITSCEGWGGDVCETFKITGSEATAATITVIGDESGVFTPVKLEGATIYSEDSASKTMVVTDLGGESGAARNILPCSMDSTLFAPVVDTTENFYNEGSQTAVKFFEITYDSTNTTLKVTATAADTAVEGAVGYLRVTYDKDYGNKPSATISFTSVYGDTSSDDILLAGTALNIDATNIAKIGGVDTAKIVIDSSIEYRGGASAGGVLRITNVPTTADVVANGVTYTKNWAAGDTGNTYHNTIEYVPTYELSSSSNTINLTGLDGLTDGQSRFFEITAVDSDHGKLVYSIGSAISQRTTNYANNGAFKVTYSATGTVFNIEYVAAGTGGVPAKLDTTAWENIQINAQGLSAGKTLNIKSVGAATSDDTHDNYTVNNAANGLVVTLTRDTASEHQDTSNITVNRVSKSTEVTFAYSDGTNTISKISLPSSGSEYWTVGEPEYEKTNTGKPTITITKANSEPSSGSYITITKGEGNDYTAVYHNGAGIALTGFTATSPATPAKVEIDAAALTAGATITLTEADDASKVDYGITDLAAGVDVVGADIGTASGKDNIAHTTTSVVLSNEVEFTLNAPAVGATANTTTYYKVKKGTVSTSTGRTAVVLDGSGTTVVPADTANYFTVVCTPTGEYTVTYHKSTSTTPADVIDLNGTNISGKTTIVATNVPKTGSIALSTKDSESNTIVNAYAVTNVVSGGLTGAGSIKVDGTDADGVVTYQTSYKLDQSAANITLAAGTYAITAGAAVKGVITYTIAAQGTPGTNSYLEVAFDSTTKATKVSFHQGTADGAVTLKDFANNITTPISIKGTSAGDGCTSLVLTEDVADGHIEYDVTGLPSTISVTNATANEDSIAYAQTYKFADNGNKLALVAGQGDVVYEVTATGGDESAKGIFTCTIGTGVAVDSTALSGYSTKNYFLAHTDASGNVTVTYHEAVDPEVTAGATMPTHLKFDTKATGVETLTIAVDPTKAAAGAKGAVVDLTFGEADGPAFAYDVSGLTAYQNAALATGANDALTVKHDTSYEVAYVDNTTPKTAIDLAAALVPATEGAAAVTKYYAVVKTGGKAEGVSSAATDKGVYTFTVSGPLDKDALADGASYIQVTYKSPYVVAVTYVNPNGETNALTTAGIENIIINADALSSTKVDTIDITETSGGDYNKVNFALTNVPTTVTSIIGNDAKDTVSYKTAGVLADGSTLTMDGTKEVMYYAVTATKSKDASGNTICSVSSTGTATKPADTANYYVVTKNGSSYVVSYHMATGAGGYGLASGNLTLDASGVDVPATDTTVGKVTTSAPGAVAIRVDDSAHTGTVTVAVDKAQGNVTGGTNVDKISYSTTFAWAPGVYYVPAVATTATSTTAIAAGTTSGATQEDGTFVAFMVEKQVDNTDSNTPVTTYVLKLADDKIQKAGADGAMSDDTNEVSTIIGKYSIALPEDITNFDANNLGLAAITGVTNGDELVNVPASRQVITDSLSAGNTVTVGTTTITAGGTGALTLYGNGQVLSGSVLLDSAEDEVTAYQTAPQRIVLDSAATTNAGVVVTFAEDSSTPPKATIASITGLDNGDQVTVLDNNNALVARYYYEDGYIVKFAGGAYSYAAPSTGDVTHLNFVSTKAVQVGQFSANTGSTYYVAVTSSTAATLAESSATPTDAVNGTTYVKAVVDNTTKVLTLSTVKGNNLHLVDATTDYSGTITVPAPTSTSGVVKYQGTKLTATTADSAYKVKFTGVKTGSTFQYLDSDDVIETDELANGATITIDNNAYTTKGVQALTFKGNALTSGTVTLAASSTLVAADGTTISYTAGDTTNGVVIVFGENGITSITGLHDKESVTLTAADGTKTVYAAGEDSWTAITRTVTSADGKVVTTNLTATGTSDDTQSNILQAAVAEGNTNKIVSNFAWPTDANKTYGYFTSTSSVAGSRNFAVAPQANAEISLTDDTVVVKAEAVYANGTSATDGIKLTLTTLKSDANGNLTATSLYGDTVTVNATAASKLVYSDTTKSYKVAFKGVAADSSITTAMAGDTIETASLGDGATLTVNGKTITSKAGTNTIGLYIASADEVCATTGTILLNGTFGAYNTAGSTPHKDTVVYAAATGAAANAVGNNGVVATFNSGAITALTDLTVGESVTITEPGGKTTTYTAVMADPTTSANTVFWQTVTGDTAANNGTKVKSVATASADAIGAYEDAVATTQGNAAFTTKYAAATNVGYFLVTKDADSATSVTVQDQDAKTEVATYKNVGDKVIKATIEADGTVSFETGTVDYKGTAGGFAASTDGQVGTLNLNVTDSQLVKVTDIGDNTAMVITGAGAGSVFTGFDIGKDKVTTAKLAKDATITFGTTVYTAGAADTTMSFDGTSVVAGVFNIKDFSTVATAFNTTATDATTKVKTESKLVYTTFTTEDTTDTEYTDGANVTVKDGKVTAVTGLNNGERVSYETTVTAKDGSKSITAITYEAETITESGAYYGMIKVTKTEVVNGVTTIYTKNFSNDTQNVADSSGWAVEEKQTVTYFNFGADGLYTSTGYFAATSTGVFDPKADGYGKYNATIAAQTGTGYPKTLEYDSNDDSNNLYLKATATKNTAGTVTLSDMELFHLESNGTLTKVTGKEVYSVALVAPAGAKIALGTHSFITNITLEDADKDYTFSGLNADDTVTATGLKSGKSVIVNDKKYTASGDNEVIVKGDTIVSGTVLLKETALTAKADGASIAYTEGSGAATDGVTVVFSENGGIGTITDLDAGEKVVITSKDGTTTTTYERDASKYTKTVKVGDQTTVWTNTTTTDAEATALNYTVSDAFAWPADTKTSVGYFKVAGSTATMEAKVAGAGYSMTAGDYIFRAEVSRKGSVYTLTSVQLLKGTTLEDVTSKEAAAVAAPAYRLTIVAPTDEGATLTLADTAIVVKDPKVATNVTFRDLGLDVSGVKAGQTILGLADNDTVTTVTIAKDAEITVGTKKFAAAADGSLSVFGDGTAKSGGFKLGSGYTISTKDAVTKAVTEVSTSGGNGAMAVVVDGALTNINQMNAGETVVVKTTSASGVVTTKTYKATAVSGDSTKMLVTRTTVADGVTKVETITINDGSDVLVDGYATEDTGNSITSAFDWTEAKGSGYFAVTDASGKLLADTVTVASQKSTKITKSDAGKIYAKVALSADNTISGITLVQIQADGTPKNYTDALSDSQKFSIAITAPAEKLTADFITNAVPDSVSTINLTGVVLKSNVVLRAGDTMETVALSPSTTTDATVAATEVVTVNGTAFKVGANTILKFGAAAGATATTGAVLKEGVLNVAAGSGFVAAGENNGIGTTALDADNVAVAVTGHDAIITVKNGMVTSISGQTTVADAVNAIPADTVTVGNVTYTLVTLGTGVAYDAVAAGTDANIVSLSNGSNFSVNGTAYISGADNNNIVVKASQFKDGVVTMNNTTANTMTLTGAKVDDPTDNITVTYTQATAGTGAAVVTVANGKVSAIKGLANGDKVEVMELGAGKDANGNAVDVVTTYTINGSQVTKSVQTGAVSATNPPVVTTAYISNGGDLFNANYFGSSSSADDLVGQFNWSSTIGGRSLGYFAMKATTNKTTEVTTYTATIANQATQQKVTKPSSGSTRYLVASVQDGELTINALEIASTGTIKTLDVTDGKTFTKSDKITITAPSNQFITYAKGKTDFAVAINGVVNNSQISGLDEGDQVATASLAIGDWVQVNGKGYIAGAKGILTFVGEGDGKATTATNTNAALLSGSVWLASGGTATAILSGNTVAKDTGLDDDITVTNKSTTDDVVVTVKDGKVSSITGLTTEDETVLVQQGTTSTLYKGMSTDGTMVSKTVWTDLNKDGKLDEGEKASATTTYASVKAGGNIAVNTYKEAVWTNVSNLSFKAGDAKSTTYAYYKLDEALTADPTDNWYELPANSTTMVTATTPTGSEAETYNADKTKFMAEPDEAYLRVTAVTTTAGVTTLTVDGMESTFNGELKKVSDSDFKAYTGTVTIDGSTGLSTSSTAYDDRYGVISFTKPKNFNGKIVATNVSYKSTFSNLDMTAGDQVTTQAITTETALAKGSYNFYYYNSITAFTETHKVTVTGDGVRVTTNADGTIKSLKGLYTKGESVTLTETTDNGTKTTVYSVTAAGDLKRTVTDETGRVVVSTATGITEDKDIKTLTESTTTTTGDWKDSTTDTTKIVADFDWTLSKSATGYFAVSGTSATAKAQKTTIDSDAKTYIAVTVNENGVVSNVAQQVFDETTRTMKDFTTDKFSGTINITAPTALDFCFDRDKLDANTIDKANTKIVISGILADSEIENLATDDSVSTAKLAKGASVSINDGTFTASAAGVLKFKIDDVDVNGTLHSAKTVLTSGSVTLDNTYGINTEGAGFIYVGDSLIEAKAGDGFTVAATLKNNKTSFTISGIGENEVFTVDGVTYQKSGSTILRTYKDDAGDSVNEIYAIGKGTSITSAVINKASNWKAVKETFTTAEDGVKTTTLGTVTVKLATAASRAKTDKYEIGGYDYIYDKYVSTSTTKKTTKGVLTGIVVENADDWQEKLGDVVVNAITNTTTYTYVATETIGQAITVATNWAVVGSDQKDTITGATSGTDFIRAGAGKDAINLKGASDTVAFDFTEAGLNTVSGYETGKDKIVIDNGEGFVTGGDYDNSFSVALDKSGNVYLFNDADGDGAYTTDETGVLLKGMGKAKAVTINDEKYFFGSEAITYKTVGKGKKAKKVAQPLAGATFAYTEEGHYFGNSSGKNTLSVGTDTSKAYQTTTTSKVKNKKVKGKWTYKTVTTTKTGLGDDVIIDLNAVDASGKSYYNKLQTVDASKSGNKVVITAAATGSTLKGGTYESTLKSGAGNDTLTGGTGKDVFWFDDLNGKDKVNSYTASKDAVYIGGTTDLEAGGYTIKASGSSVVISKDSDTSASVTIASGAGKAISISADGLVGGEKVNYYVGKVGTSKKKAANSFKYEETAYYVGNNLATDTINLASGDKGVTIDMTGANASRYQSVDAINASKVSYNANTDTKYTDKVAGGETSGTKSGVGVKITAGETAVSITGTKYADTITCGNTTTINYTRNTGNDVITNFDVNDVIKFNNLTKADKDAIASKITSFNRNGGVGDLTLSIGDNKVKITTTGTSALSFDKSSGKLNAK